MRMRMRRIKKIGVELEGGWDKPTDVKIVHDGSVNVNCKYKCGEIQSPAFRNLEELFLYIEENYPQQVNGTCGLHIHISLSNLDYSRLIDRNFYNYFLEKMKEWGEKNQIKNNFFWERLNGGNAYCKKNFIADEQIKAQEKHSIRYTQLNYCYALHKTIECRLFPTFKSVEIAKEAIKKFVEIVEEWLKNYCKREKTYACKVNDENNEAITIKYEEVIE